MTIAFTSANGADLDEDEMPRSVALHMRGVP